MAFVTRSTKQIDFAKQDDYVGPGAYEAAQTKVKKQNFIQEANAPFKCGDLRDMDKEPRVKNPGPGEYTHEPNFSNTLDINFKQQQH